MDPLQNILDCAAMIQQARRCQRPGDWLPMIGEVDHLCEIQRQMEEVGNG